VSLKLINALFRRKKEWVKPLKTTLGALTKLMTRPDGCALEFKETKNEFSYEHLLDYCCAIANEGGQNDIGHH